MKGKLSEEQLQTILRAVDTDKNGAINYTEFIAATLRADVYSDTQRVENAFEMLDRDGNGYIEEKELAEIIGGWDVGEETVKRLISEVDQNGDCKIDLNEFKKMIEVLKSKS